MTENNKIEHYGVKGMHWGIRKSRSTGSGSKKGKSGTSFKDKVNAKKAKIGRALKKKYNSLDPKKVETGKVIAGTALAAAASWGIKSYFRPSSSSGLTTTQKLRTELMYSQKRVEQGKILAKTIEGLIKQGG